MGQTMNFGESVPAKKQTFWADMKTIEQAAATMLGWNPTAWEEGWYLSHNCQYWNKLTEEEQASVFIMGYTPHEWNQAVEEELFRQFLKENRQKARAEWENSKASSDLASCLLNFKNLANQELSKSNVAMLSPPLICRQKGAENLSVFPQNTTLTEERSNEESHDQDYYGTKDFYRREGGKHSNNRKQVRWRNFAKETRLNQRNAETGELSEDDSSINRKWNAREFKERQEELNENN